MEMPEGWKNLNRSFDYFDEFKPPVKPAEITTCLNLMKQMAEDLEFMEKKYGHQPMSALKKFKEWK